MVKAIIFDCFGVLTTDYWKEFVATLPESQVEVARPLIYKYDAGQLSRTEFLDQVETLTGRLPKAVESLLEDEMIKNDDLLKFIKHLKATYKIGLLSNIGSNWIQNKFLTANEKALFDDMILSYEVGMAKPDPEIYQLAAERLNVEPKVCLMIDDSPGHCHAAKKLGMEAIVYKNFEQMKRDLTTILAS